MWILRFAYIICLTVFSVNMFFTEFMPPETFYNRELESLNQEHFKMLGELYTEAVSLGIDFDYYLYSDSIYDDLDEKIEEYRQILPLKLQNDSIYHRCNSYDICRRYYKGRRRGKYIDQAVFSYNSAVSNYIRLYELVNDKKQRK